MAFIYEKRDEKNPKKARWYASVTVRSKQVRVSLSLISNGSRRLAERRATALQEECDLGELSEETRAWLPSTAFDKIQSMFGNGSPMLLISWVHITDQYLTSCSSNDTRPSVEGKINPINRTAHNRAYLLRRFSQWAGSRINEDFEGLAIEYLAHEINRGSSANSVRSGPYIYLCLMGDWLADHGMCRPINRKKIKKSLPNPTPPSVRIAEWQADLKVMRAIHKARHASPSNWSAWCLISVVRGLGCRPSEAISLSWDTVDLKPGFETVKFLHTKEGGNRGLSHRTAPVLFEWVREALEEMKAKSKSRVVCVGAWGEHWYSDSTAANSINRMEKRLGLPKYNLKQAQKLCIRHLIQVGFPPHVIAFWTGHTLSMQEKHYIQEDAYLPSEDRDYAEFGKLSEHGRKALVKFRADLG